MALFGKKSKVLSCPICAASVDPRREGMTHWSSHVRQIPEGEGDASGQWTWECTCGPSGMKWPNEFSASSALAIHTYRSHDIPLGSPLRDDPTFLAQMERKLGLR